MNNINTNVSYEDMVPPITFIIEKDQKGGYLITVKYGI